MLSIDYIQYAIVEQKFNNRINTLLLNTFAIVLVTASNKCHFVGNGEEMVEIYEVAWWNWWFTWCDLVVASRYMILCLQIRRVRAKIPITFLGRIGVIYIDRKVIGWIFSQCCFYWLVLPWNACFLGLKFMYDWIFWFLAFSSTWWIVQDLRRSRARF